MIRKLQDKLSLTMQDQTQARTCKTRHDDDNYYCVFVWGCFCSVGTTQFQYWVTAVLSYLKQVIWECLSLLFLLPTRRRDEDKPEDFLSFYRIAYWRAIGRDLSHTLRIHESSTWHAHNSRYSASWSKGHSKSTLLEATNTKDVQYTVSLVVSSCVKMR